MFTWWQFIYSFNNDFIQGEYVSYNKKNYLVLVFVIDSTGSFNQIYCCLKYSVLVFHVLYSLVFSFSYQK